MFQILKKLFSKKNNISTEKEENTPIVKPEPILCNKGMIDILCIADTHQTLTSDEVKLLDDLTYDICLLLGDIPYNDMELLTGHIDMSKTYGLLGNHDELDTLNHFNIPNLHMDSIKINEYSITGFQGTNRYKSGKRPMYSQEEACVLIDNLPQCDIIVTHDSPYNIYAKDDAHIGLQGISNYIKRCNPALHIQGHIHRNDKTCLENGTTNISVFRAVHIYNYAGVFFSHEIF